MKLSLVHMHDLQLAILFGLVLVLECRPTGDTSWRSLVLTLTLTASFVGSDFAALLCSQGVREVFKHSQLATVLGV